MAARCAGADQGHPLLLRCHPLIAGPGGGRVRPFPTRHWLACPDLCRQLAELERTGTIARVQALIAADPALGRRLRRDHAVAARERLAALSKEELDEARRAGVLDGLARRGLGGTADPSRVKCLHLHYAHHLVHGGVVGALLEDRGLIRPCAAAAATAAAAAEARRS